MGVKLLNRMFFVLSLAVSLTACSGGESGTGATEDDQDQIISIGTITGFGSVYVNSVKYETAGAEIIINETSVQEDELALGMVVVVSGTVSQNNQLAGHANKIEYDSDIEGVVFGKLADGGLNVMGQTVTHDGATVFESDVNTITDIASINPNAVVEVSGFRQSSGVLYATRLKLKSEQFINSELCVKGKITLLDDATFMIGDLVISYGSAVFKNIPDDQLADGMLVKVVAHEIDSQNQLVAEQIQYKKHMGADAGMMVAMEGMVSNPDVPGGEFELNGIYIQFGENTQFIAGSRLDLIGGAKLKLVGDYVAEDTILANKIVFLPSGTIKILANVDLVDATSNYVTVLGRKIDINNNTLTKDLTTGKKQKQFGIQNVNINDLVIIKAYLSENEIIATQLMRKAEDNSDNAVSLTGELQQFNPLGDNQIVVSTFSILIPQSEKSRLSIADIGKTITLTGHYDSLNGFIATDFKLLQ